LKYNLPFLGPWSVVVFVSVVVVFVVVDVFIVVGCRVLQKSYTQKLRFKTVPYRRN